MATADWQLIEAVDDAMIEEGHATLRAAIASKALPANPVVLMHALYGAAEELKGYWEGLAAGRRRSSRLASPPSSSRRIRVCGTCRVRRTRSWTGCSPRLAITTRPRRRDGNRPDTSPRGTDPAELAKLELEAARVLQELDELLPSPIASSRASGQSPRRCACVAAGPS
jgi:hypothetical protein